MSKSSDIVTAWENRYPVESRFRRALKLKPVPLATIKALGEPMHVLDVTSENIRKEQLDKLELLLKAARSLSRTNAQIAKGIKVKYVTVARMGNGAVGLRTIFRNKPPRQKSRGYWALFWLPNPG